MSSNDPIKISAAGALSGQRYDLINPILDTQPDALGEAIYCVLRQGRLPAASAPAMQQTRPECSGELSVSAALSTR
jgi:hypothetical protein